MFEFDLNNNELEALDAILAACVGGEDTALPVWTYMGQDVWTMDFAGDVPEAASEWSLETADFA